MYKSITAKTGIVFPLFIRVALKKIGIDSISDFARLKSEEIDMLIHELESKVGKYYKTSIQLVKIQSLLGKANRQWHCEGG
jgi:hypothetical protein